MRSIEEELKSALARQSPPPYFTARVLAAIECERPIKGAGRGWNWPAWTWNWRAATALATVLTATAGTMYVQHERVVRGEEAKQKLLVAMHIAGSELQHARQRIFEVQAGEAK